MDNETTNKEGGTMTDSINYNQYFKGNTGNAKLRDIAKSIEPDMQCNCDLDNWEPERAPQYSGHSWVCRIHKKALSILAGDCSLPEKTYSGKDAEINRAVDQTEGA